MYFYLEVDRLDDISVGAFYYPLGTEPELLIDRLVRRLEFYRRKGFSITHFEERPYYKEAKNRTNNIKLSLTVMFSEKPMQLAANVWSEGDAANAEWEGNDGSTVLH